MNLFILRGVPGSGKSTLANIFTLNESVGKICEADKFFMKDGVYNYDRAKIGEAHEFCQKECQYAMVRGISTIVVSNTNVAPKDFAPYEKLAKTFGYKVFHIIVENRHGNTNSHNVPEEVLTRMKNTLKENVCL